MQKNYVVYHLHSDLSNATTNIDSVTKYKEYIEYAKGLGMTAMAFSEHGNIFSWYNKKLSIEATGMLYIHAEEFYLTEQIETKVRDNYHCILIAKNYEGFKELNRLSSLAYHREDNHFYYAPRLTFDELCGTSDNIIITSACVAGPISKGTEEIKEKFIDFFMKNKDRCFLEVQHHNVDKQKEYNIYLSELSQKTGIRLIAGTDTHALNATHMLGRKKLQEGKDVHFPEEEDWDMTFKTYEELVEAYRVQGVLDEKIYLEAIENTNLLQEMVEPFEIDTSIKYPKIYENSTEIFKKKINEGYKSNPYIKKYPIDMVRKKIQEEVEVYEKVGAVDFMLMENYLVDWEKKNGIHRGPGRGSVSGSIVAYLLGITEMDSIKFDLNFFRFMNPARVTNADIDCDYYSPDRDKMKEFLLRDKMDLPQIQSAEIITFNTIAMKGAIKDIARGMGFTPEQAQEICNNLTQDEKKNDVPTEEQLKKYPELFKYVNIVKGTTVSVGTHPSGVLIADINVDEEMGTCSISSTPYPVTDLYMKELDKIMAVKLDILGLDSLNLITKTCEMVGIERLTPDNTPLDDEAVWKSIRDDTTTAFQWESPGARQFIKKFMSDKVVDEARKRDKNFSYIKWFSFGNGLIRPSCASFRDDIANGKFFENGMKELDEMFAKTSGKITMQEDLMRFCSKFCGYSDAEADTVRRAVAKKEGTDGILQEIHDRFVDYSHKTYGTPIETLEKIAPSIIQIVKDASGYGFSWNHSDAYSCIGYICGYLRYYYPLEFLTTAFNTFYWDKDETDAIIKYANKVKIKVEQPKFRKSVSEYTMDKEENAIYKGLNSIKYISDKCAEQLYDMRYNQYDTFTDLLVDIIENTTVNKRQVEGLTALNFFSEFGYNNKLLEVVKKFYDRYKKTHKEKTKEERIKEIKLYEEGLEDTSLPIQEQIDFEKNFLGYISFQQDGLKRYCYVMDVNTKFAPRVTLYSFGNGKIVECKVKKSEFNKQKFKKNDIVYTEKFSLVPDWAFVDGQHVKKGTSSYCLDKYKKITYDDFDKIINKMNVKQENQKEMVPQTRYL